MILDTLVSVTRERIERQKKIISPAEIKTAALSRPKKNFEFEKALRGDDIRFICEVKKASPSKGIIAEEFPYVEIAKEYEKAGAAAVSVLTEPEYFKGEDSYVTDISRNISLPIIRKDFTVDE